MPPCIAMRRDSISQRAAQPMAKEDRSRRQEDDVPGDPGDARDVVVDEASPVERHQREDPRDQRPQRRPARRCPWRRAGPPSATARTPRLAAIRLAAPPTNRHRAVAQPAPAAATGPSRAAGSRSPGSDRRGRRSRAACERTVSASRGTGSWIPGSGSGDGPARCPAPFPARVRSSTAGATRLETPMIHRTTGWLTILVCALAPGLGFAEEKPDSKTDAKPQGPRYVNKEAGVMARGPAGWRMKGRQGRPGRVDAARDLLRPRHGRGHRVQRPQEVGLRVRRACWARCAASGTRRLRCGLPRCARSERSTVNKVPHVVVDAKFTPQAEGAEGGRPAAARAVHRQCHVLHRARWGVPALRTGAADALVPRGTEAACDARLGAVRARRGASHPGRRPVRGTSATGSSACTRTGATVMTKGLPHVIAFVPTSADEPRIDVLSPLARRECRGGREAHRHALRRGPGR